MVYPFIPVGPFPFISNLCFFFFLGWSEYIFAKWDNEMRLLEWENNLKCQTLKLSSFWIDRGKETKSRMKSYFMFDNVSGAFIIFKGTVSISEEVNWYH